MPVTFPPGRQAGNEPSPTAFALASMTIGIVAVADLLASRCGGRSYDQIDVELQQFTDKRGKLVARKSTRAGSTAHIKRPLRTALLFDQEANHATPD